MADITLRCETLEQAIMRGMERYIQGRADEIIEKVSKQAVEEIKKGVKEEVVKTVLQLQEVVSINNMGRELIIKIDDRRKHE